MSATDLEQMRRTSFALKADIQVERDGLLTDECARLLVMGLRPRTDVAWWLELEARLRYMKADAMIKVCDATELRNPT